MGRRFCKCQEISTVLTCCFAKFKKKKNVNYEVRHQTQNYFQDQNMQSTSFLAILAGAKVKTSSVVWLIPGKRSLYLQELAVKEKYSGYKSVWRAVAKHPKFRFFFYRGGGSLFTGRLCFNICLTQHVCLCAEFTRMELPADAHTHTHMCPPARVHVHTHTLWLSVCYIISTHIKINIL